DAENTSNGIVGWVDSGYTHAMKRVLTAIVLTLLIALTGLADTLYLRDGSVLQGRFLGYENGQFIFELENGRERRFRPSEVLRLVMEQGDTAPSADSSGRWEVQPAIDVRLAEQWIKTGIMLSRGMRVRVNASGTITLDGRTQTGPDGVNGRRDPDAPMPDENDGALIAIIGKEENAPEILIGRQREFTAEQDGELYLTVNHWQIQNTRGAFRVEISLDRTGGAVQEDRPSAGRVRTVTVNANQPWTDTGIDLTPNLSLEIVAEGTIDVGGRVMSGPDGNQNAARRRLPVPDLPAGALIARIRYRDGRYSNVIGIGARSTPATEEGEYGRLFLGVNDDYFDDNRGSFTVRVRW
ncbi:MAG: hypothetical protein ACKOB4_19700, partial [Acidobacteriota bacterium]